jgi:hypothetical protein
MSSPNNEPATSISPKERAELNATMKARYNAVKARGPVAKIGDRITNKFGKQGTIRSIMNDDYFVRMNNQNNNNDYKVFHGNELNALRKAKRRANITAGRAAKGLTPDRISFNPEAIAQNRETHPLGPNNGPVRPGGVYVPGSFSKLEKGYSGFYNKNVRPTPGSLWQTPEEIRAVRRERHSLGAQHYENAVNPEKAKERANKLHENLIGPDPAPAPASAPWYRSMFGLSGGNTKRNRNRKQKTKKQRKNRK